MKKFLNWLKEHPGSFELFILSHPFPSIYVINFSDPISEVFENEELKKGLENILTKLYGPNQNLELTLEDNKLVISEPEIYKAEFERNYYYILSVNRLIQIIYNRVTIDKLPHKQSYLNHLGFQNIDIETEVFEKMRQDPEQTIKNIEFLYPKEVLL